MWAVTAGPVPGTGGDPASLERDLPFVGRHTHPGNAIAVVKSGTLTIYDGDDPSCTGRHFSAGQVYLDPGSGHVHLGRNESTRAPLEIVVTYLDFPLGGGVREDSENSGNCTF